MAVGETSRVSMLSVRPTLARDRPSPYGSDGKCRPEANRSGSGDPALQNENPDNLANLVNPAHILKILLLLF